MRDKVFLFFDPVMTPKLKLLPFCLTVMYYSG